MPGEAHRAQAGGGLPLIAYDINAAAAATSVSDKTIRMAILSGELKARMLGRKYLIQDADLRAWIAGLPEYRVSRA